MNILALLLTALLFGGMTLYAFGFAAFALRALPEETARPLIRRAFPHFYLFVLGTAALAAVCAAFSDLLSTVILVVIALTTLYARQSLMPRINAATPARADQIVRLAVSNVATPMVSSDPAFIRLTTWSARI